MYKLVLVRHGESLWNSENRFTGWQDIDLSPKGRDEAQRAGKTLSELIGKGEHDFDFAYCSVLKRAIHTLWISLDEMDRAWLPIKNDWRLNERHYGGLTGLNKTETAKKYGEDQVKIWRRSYDIPPPAMEKSDPRHPSQDLRYKKIPPALLPNSESLKDTVARFLPLWLDEIEPAIKSGKRILIVAHGNSLRALIQYVEKMSAEEIVEVNLPTGIPLMYEFDRDMKVIRKNYLGDPKMVKAAIDAVVNQGKIQSPQQKE